MAETKHNEEIDTLLRQRDMLMDLLKNVCARIDTGHARLVLIKKKKCFCWECKMLRKIEAAIAEEKP